MPKTRFSLFLFSLIGIVSIIFMLIILGDIFGETYKVFGEWISVLGKILFASVVINFILVYCYAQNTGRPGIVWAFGALMMPIITPFVLALIPPAVSQEDRISWALAENMVIPQTLAQEEADGSHGKEQEIFPGIKDPSPVFNLGGIFGLSGIFGSSALALDELRLFCIRVTTDVKWRVVATSAAMDYIFPDLMSQPEAEYHYRVLANRGSGNLRGLVGYDLCLADYHDRGVIINLYDFGKKAIPLLEGLYHFREKRIEKLKQWLAGNPSVTLERSKGLAIILDKNGFGYKGPADCWSWQDIELIKTNTAHGSTEITFVLKGRSGGRFDFKSPSYSFDIRKGYPYTAEFYFWKTLNAQMQQS